MSISGSSNIWVHFRLALRNKHLHVIVCPNAYDEFCWVYQTQHCIGILLHFCGAEFVDIHNVPMGDYSFWVPFAKYYLFPHSFHTVGSWGCFETSVWSWSAWVQATSQLRSMTMCRNAPNESVPQIACGEKSPGYCLLVARRMSLKSKDWGICPTLTTCI